MNILNRIKSWVKSRKEHRRSRKIFRQQMKQMSAVAVVHETLNKFRQAGLLYIDLKRNNITISAALANFYIGNPTDWQNFLEHLRQWAVFQYSVSEYVRLYNKTILDAAAEARAKQNSDSEDVSRAKFEAAERFDSSEVSQKTKMPDFQFIVLGAADGEPLVVARFVDGRYITAPVPEELLNENRYEQ